MLFIDGTIKVLPLSVGAEGGALQQEDGTKSPAVVLYFQTNSGVIEVVLPPENIDKVIDALSKAKEDTQEIPKTDLIVSKNIKEAEDISAVQNQIKGK
jgi:predicted transglutaminase-like protease